MPEVEPYFYFVRLPYLFYQYLRQMFYSASEVNFGWCWPLIEPMSNNILLNIIVDTAVRCCFSEMHLRALVC